MEFKGNVWITEVIFYEISIFYHQIIEVHLQMLKNNGL